MVIQDLGITIWRNEYYPPSTAQHTQDAQWDKQRPVVKGLHETAQEHNVDLKFVFSVWSPPARMKVKVDEDDNRHPDTPHPGGTKDGGTLDPDACRAFGQWLAEGVQLYKDLGYQTAFPTSSRTRQIGHAGRRTCPNGRRCRPKAS